MRILMLGISHHTASVALRERLALAGAALDQALDGLRAAFPAAEVVVLSTCNRTEFYFARPSHEPPTPEHLWAFLETSAGVTVTEITAASVHRENEQAVAHLFRVCAGLESMVLGEPQILGQVRRAYDQATQRQAVGPVLHRVFQQALAVGKQARHETGIDEGRLSIGSIAVEFAQQIFESFDDKIIVGLGAGEMAKLALTHLRALKPARLWLANRTQGRAEALAAKLGIAPPHGGVRPFEALDELLVEADVVLTSTAAPAPIIAAARFKPLLRRRRGRPLFIIDLAVPRDVEPAVGTLANVYLYNLDDLQRVVATNLGQRQEQVRQCEALLQAAVRDCLADVQNRDLGQLIRALRDRLHELGELERQRTARKLAAAAPEELADLAPALLEEHTHRLINKILHLPLSQLDKRPADTPASFYAAALRRLFDLEEPAIGAPAPPAPAVPAESPAERGSAGA